MGMREDYQALMEKRLNEWKAQADRIKADAESMQAHMKAQYEAGLKMLQARQNEAWDNFHKLKDANEATWAQVKAHMDSAGEQVKKAMEAVTSRFK